MAHVLSITNGTTTITLASSAKRLLDYVPRTPNGDERAIIDTAVISIEETSIASNLAAIAAVNRMFVQARRRRISGQGARVFMLWQPDGSSITWRSELYSQNPRELPGRLQPDGTFLGRPLWTNHKRVKANLIFSRRPFWENNSLVQIPLTNANETGDTDGLKIYNNNDGTGAAGSVRNNYVEMAAAAVLGELETPLYIEYTNTFGTAARRVYLAHKAQGTPASFTHVLEAEDATLNATYAASAVDADCSGGDKVTVTDVSASEVTLMTWTISSTEAGYIPSQWIKILGRFEDLPSNATCKVRFLVQDSTTTAQIGQSEWVTLSNADALQQLGTVILSPNLQGQTAAGAIKLVLRAKDSAAVCDFGLDFIQLSPSELGQGFRTLKPVDESLVSIPATTGVITDNMIDEALSIESRQNVYLGFGGPIMLVPNTINRLYVLRDNTDATAAVASTMTLKAYHRQRVTTVG